MPSCRSLLTGQGDLYEKGKAIHDEGGLNLAHLMDEQQIEAEIDYRICADRGTDQDTTPKRRQRRLIRDDDEQECPR